MGSKETIMTEKPDFMKGIFIPPQPRIIDDVRDASPDLVKIAAFISKDAGISANVLRTVNSPAYNLPNKISSISQAVMLLGLDSVINIINGLMIRVAFEKYDTESLVEFWRLNEDIALASAILAKRLDLAPSADAYLLGLFHACGIPAIRTKFPQYMSSLKEAFEQSDLSPSVYLDNLVNTNHGVVGFWIAKTWNLPSNVCNAIRDHIDRSWVDHRNEETDGLLICLKLAQRVCDSHVRLMGADENAHWPFVKETILTELGMSDLDWDDLSHEIVDQLHS